MAGKALTPIRDSHAMRVIEQLQETGSRLAATTLPQIARTARQTGRSLTDFAQSTGKDIAGRISERDPAALRRLVGSASALRTTGGVARFALRRPVVIGLGVIAVAGLAVVVGRRLKAAKAARETQDSNNPGIGEGSQEGARDYRQRTERFVKDKGDTISRRAREAEDALEGDEYASLDEAEQEGLRHARN